MIHKLGVKIKSCKRYVDDVFVPSNVEHIDRIPVISNSICPSIQFTIEIESNCRLSFLDISSVNSETLLLRN